MSTPVEIKINGEHYGIVASVKRLGQWTALVSYDATREVWWVIILRNASREEKQMIPGEAATVNGYRKERREDVFNLWMSLVEEGDIADYVAYSKSELANTAKA